MVGNVCLLNPRMCASEGASLCTHKNDLPGQPVCSPRPRFRLALSKNCVQAYLRFRVGSHRLPCICVMVALQTFLELRKSAHCVEQHLVVECPALQGLEDRYNGLFGDHAATIVIHERENESKCLFLSNKHSHRILSKAQHIPHQLE